MKIIIKKTFFILFLVSFLYYVFWFGYCIMLFWKGADPGWAAPALSNDIMVYGWEAFGIGMGKFLFFTCFYCWLVPLYQLTYGIVRLILKKKSKHIAS